MRGWRERVREKKKKRKEETNEGQIEDGWKEGIFQEVKQFGSLEKIKNKKMASESIEKDVENIEEMKTRMDKKNAKREKTLWYGGHKENTPVLKGRKADPKVQRKS